VSNTETNPVPEKLVSGLLADDPDMFDLVEDFVNGLGDRIEEMRSAFESLDWDSLSKIAHQMKGAGGSYGYSDVSSLAAAMEASFKAHSSGQFEEWMATLQKMITAAHAGLDDSRPT
jgi:HPt (histidine-containing phosphotransfer) domain-containing protein